MTGPASSADIRRRRRLLYIDAYTLSEPGHSGAPSSDAIGYGITASTAIRRGLQAAGYDVVLPDVPSDSGNGNARLARARWVIASYARILRILAEEPPDLIFSFHIFYVFPAEIRRMLLDLRLPTPVVGYTHGSHWDTTDTFRFEVYPGMEMVDLANLHVLDRTLLVSQYMRETLHRSISAFNADLAGVLDAKARVVGLPLDTDRIDRNRTEERFDRTTVVFNHAPVTSKRPEVFVAVMRRILTRYPVGVLFTRKFDSTAAGAAAVHGLAEEFGDRVVLGGDLTLDEYYRALWMSDIQVSTATHESLGVATLEAMYTGTCCLLPAIGSYPEICDGHAEVLYDGSPGELEGRLGYFIEHPGRRGEVGEELRALAQNYRPEAVVRKIVDVLAGV